MSLTRFSKSSSITKCNFVISNECEKSQYSKRFFATAQYDKTNK